MEVFVKELAQPDHILHRQAIFALDVLLIATHVTLTPVVLVAIH